MRIQQHCCVRSGLARRTSRSVRTAPAAWRPHLRRRVVLCAAEDVGLGAVGETQLVHVHVGAKGDQAHLEGGGRGGGGRGGGGGGGAGPRAARAAVNTQRLAQGMGGDSNVHCDKQGDR